MRPLYKDPIFTLFLGFILASLCMMYVYDQREKHCYDYVSQLRAQADVNKFPALDGNPKNGFACDSYPFPH